MSTATVEQVIEALRPVQDPELHRSIVDLGMVRDVVIGRKGDVSLTVVLTVAGCPVGQRRVGRRHPQGSAEDQRLACAA